MKITTLWTSPFKKGQYYTSEDAALAAFVGSTLVQLTGYPAVELDNGTFRLIDSDAIVAADREVVNPVWIYEPVTWEPGTGKRRARSGKFFLSVYEALTQTKNVYTADGFQAIPQPDGSYLRVKEGDIVRLWEPEKIPTPPSAGTPPDRKAYAEIEKRHQEELRRVECARKNLKASIAGMEKWLEARNREAEFRLDRLRKSLEKAPTVAKAGTSPRAVPFDELDEQLKAVVMAVASFGATQAAPESVEKPPVTAVPESEASGAQDDFFAGLKGVELHLKLTENPTGQAFVDKILETDHDRRVREYRAKMDALRKQRETKARLIESRIARCGQQVKSILTLPAGPERAEAKLKLISEIAKL